MTSREPTPANDSPKTSLKSVLARLLPVIEWFTRRSALRDATAEHPEAKAIRAWIARAGKDVSVADRVLDPPDGAPREPEVARVLLVDAAELLVRAANAGPVAGADLLEHVASARERADPELSRWLAADGVPPGLALERDAFAELSSERQLESVRAIQAWVHGLRAALERKYGKLRRLQFERLLRLSVISVLACVLVVAGLLRARRSALGPDLAAGKPWRASSSADTCNPEKGVCAGAHTKVFFHTNEENNPWFEIDLLDTRRVRRVEVQNRRDAWTERAIPLVVELSTDGQNYWQVARRVEPFMLWEAEFAPQIARYVRLRVARRTNLHLERVSVRQ